MASSKFVERFTLGKLGSGSGGIPREESQGWYANPEIIVASMTRVHKETHHAGNRINCRSCQRCRELGRLRRHCLQRAVLARATSASRCRLPFIDSPRLKFPAVPLFFPIPGYLLPRRKVFAARFGRIGPDARIED